MPVHPKLPRGWKWYKHWRQGDADGPNPCKGWYVVAASSKHIEKLVPFDEGYANGSSHVSASAPTLYAARKACVEEAVVKQAAFKRRKIKLIPMAQGTKGWDHDPKDFSRVIEVPIKRRVEY